MFPAFLEVQSAFALSECWTCGSSWTSATECHRERATDPFASPRCECCSSWLLPSQPAPLSSLPTMRRQKHHNQVLLWWRLRWWQPRRRLRLPVLWPWPSVPAWAMQLPQPLLGARCCVKQRANLQWPGLPWPIRFSPSGAKIPPKCHIKSFQLFWKMYDSCLVFNFQAFRPSSIISSWCTLYTSVHIRPSRPPRPPALAQVAGCPCLGGAHGLLPRCHQLHAVHPALRQWQVSTMRTHGGILNFRYFLIFLDALVACLLRWHTVNENMWHKWMHMTRVQKWSNMSKKVSKKFSGESRAFVGHPNPGGTVPKAVLQNSSRLVDGAFCAAFFVGTIPELWAMAEHERMSVNACEHFPKTCYESNGKIEQREKKVMKGAWRFALGSIAETF